MITVEAVESEPWGGLYVGYFSKLNITRNRRVTHPHAASGQLQAGSDVEHQCSLIHTPTQFCNLNHYFQELSNTQSASMSSQQNIKTEQVVGESPPELAASQHAEVAKDKAAEAGNAAAESAVEAGKESLLVLEPLYEFFATAHKISVTKAGTCG